MVSGGELLPSHGAGGRREAATTCDRRETRTQAAARCFSTHVHPQSRGRTVTKKYSADVKNMGQGYLHSRNIF